MADALRRPRLIIFTSRQYRRMSSLPTTMAEHASARRSFSMGFGFSTANCERSSFHFLQDFLSGGAKLLPQTSSRGARSCQDDSA